MLFSFYLLDIAVIQYWTFSRVRLLTPTVILIFPIPVSSYSMIIIRSNGFWFAFPGFGFLTDTFLAPVKIESNCGLDYWNHPDVDVFLQRKVELSLRWILLFPLSVKVSDDSLSGLNAFNCVSCRYHNMFSLISDKINMRMCQSAIQWIVFCGMFHIFVQINRDWPDRNSGR